MPIRVETAKNQSLLGVVALVGTVYTLVGVVFGLPTGHVRAWRLAAWVVSGMAYAIHVGYECLRLRNTSLSSALHAASAAAFGAFGLAVVANVHSLSVATANQQHKLLLIALVAWPVITGAPAFLVGLAASSLLLKLSRRGHVD